MGYNESLYGRSWRLDAKVTFIMVLHRHRPVPKDLLLFPVDKRK